MPNLYISIHALREEGDHLRCRLSLATSLFLSTPSARRATGCFISFWCLSEISIHALREEGDQNIMLRAEQIWISIHALREEGNPISRRLRRKLSNFYPRPPRGGRPTMPPSFGSMERISIHALREEGDWPMALMPARALHFYPRPPRGGRLRSGTSA